jgi:ABC-2 type transport system permease protein
MEQLFATPVGRLEIVVGKLLPYFVIGVAQLLIVLAAGLWLFDVPMRGSPWSLAALSAVFLVATLAQGLLISVVAKNQMVATQMAAMSSMLPSMMLSGFVLPIDNMPVVLQWITTRCRPATSCTGCARSSCATRPSSRSRRTWSRWRCSPAW